MFLFDLPVSERYLWRNPKCTLTTRTSIKLTVEYGVDSTLYSTVRYSCLFNLNVGRNREILTQFIRPARKDKSYRRPNMVAIAIMTVIVMFVVVPLVNFMVG